jgi:ABC-type transporter Mla subunit MlaD
MAEYRRSEIVSGILFIAASILVFVWFFMKARGYPIPGVERAGVEFEAEFDDIGYLDEAAKVTAGGRRIGTVSGFERRETVITAAEVEEEKKHREELPAGWEAGRIRQTTLVRFKITDEDLRLADDATVAVVQEGFIGQWHLAVEPGTWAANQDVPPVKRRGGGPPIRLKTRRVGTLKDLLPSVKPVIQRVDSILARIETDFLKPLLEGKGEALAAMVPELQAMLADARKGVNEARELLDPGKEGSPVRHFNKLMDDTNASVTDLKNRLTSEILPPIRSAITEGEAALKAARKTLEDASALVTENRPNLKDLLANLKEESGRLEKRLDDIQKRLATFLDSADQFVSLQQSDLAVIVETLRNTAWEIEQAARKIRANPSVVIFGDDETNRIEAEPRDDSGLRKSGRVKPYEKRDETPAKKE